MTDNMSAHIINQACFAYMNVRTSRIPFWDHFSFSINTLPYTSSAVLYAGKYFRVVQRQEGGGHLQPWLLHKMGAVPWFNPSLPKDLSPSLLTFMPTSTPLLLSRYIAPSHFTTLYNNALLYPPLPAWRNFAFCKTNSSILPLHCPCFKNIKHTNCRWNCINKSLLWSLIRNEMMIKYEGWSKVKAVCLTILNPFHSIWEMLAVVSRSLPPHTTATATPQQRKSLTLSLPHTVSFFPFPVSLVPAWVLAACREQHTTERASPSSTDAERRMVRLERWMRESAGLQQAFLPPSPPTALPSSPQPPAQSPAQLEGQIPPTPPPPHLSFWGCDWLLGLPVSPQPHLPLPQC